VFLFGFNTIHKTNEKQAGERKNKTSLWSAMASGRLFLLSSSKKQKHKMETSVCIHYLGTYIASDQ